VVPVFGVGVLIFRVQDVARLKLFISEGFALIQLELNFVGSLSSVSDHFELIILSIILFFIFVLHIKRRVTHF